ncbi:zinc c2h2 finger domain containing protein [Ophiostoma piceae UAMH 11346]|uniref:Zinc c2h2 finger domain containing protein n=1 Tax=Ophiostoma piceae (strain UAMH 11346) TaxID=1262450 RepID=S3C0R1_OPHP1|nr:zinc c2h2 finger domain containing protein [Ophiostoma piceae UAMH 11346]
MDIDEFDPELPSWVSSWTAPPQQLQHQQQQQQQHIPQHSSLPTSQLSMTTPHQQLAQQQQQPQQHHHQLLQQQQHPPPQGPLPPQPHQHSQHQHQHQHQHQPPPHDHTQPTQHLLSFASPLSAFDISSVPVAFANSDLAKAGTVLGGPDDFLFPDDETAVLSSQINVQSPQQRQSHQQQPHLSQPAQPLPQPPQHSNHTQQQQQQQQQQQRTQHQTATQLQRPRAQVVQPKQEPQPQKQQQAIHAPSLQEPAPLPSSQEPQTVQSAQSAQSPQSTPAPPGLDLNDPSTLELYDDMLIFSRGKSNTNDKLTFANCDAAKEAVLHRLALKFKLSYSYDPVQRKASIWRPSAFAPVMQTPIPAPTPAPVLALTPVPFATPVPTSAMSNVPSPMPTPLSSHLQPQPQAPLPSPSPSHAEQSTQIDTEMAMSSISSMPSMSTTASPTIVSYQDMSSMSQNLPSLPSSPAQYDDTPTQHRHNATSTAPVTFPLLQQDTNTVGLAVGLTPPPLRRMSSDSSAAASAVSSGHMLTTTAGSFSEEVSQPDHHPDHSSLHGSQHGSQHDSQHGSQHGGHHDSVHGSQPDLESPSLGDRLSSSWNIFHHGISSRRPRGRRGPLSAKSRKDIKDLEWAGGACWRCKILRRKCDPGIPCKNCPAPDLREDAPPWPLIGCRRGNLRDAMPPQVLCTKSRILLAACANRKMPAILAAENVVDHQTTGPNPAQPDVVTKCFRDAEVQCLSDNKLVLDNPGLFLRTHKSSQGAHHFSESIRNGRYRANASLNIPCQVQKDRTSQATYSDFIAGIAWELADNSECLNVLEIESVESLMALLETACLYEVEIGKSPMVALSLVCLRNCLDVLRLSSANILHARIHSTCKPERCSIHCMRQLTTCIDTYIEELSLLMFRKVNLRDRRWWLSTFYSLCIQAYVRRALLAIEQQLLYPNNDDADADVLYSSQYLHLVTVLFIAVSFQYDPLVSTTGGLRLQQSMLAEEDGSTPDMFVPDRYFAAGRTACAVDIWADEGIKSSYQFLTRLLNIGSLDFDMGQENQAGGTSAGGNGLNNDDTAMEGSDAVLPLRHLHGIKASETLPFTAYSSPNSSTTSFASSLSAPRSSTGVISPPSSIGPSMSSASSPRTSLLVNERRSSIGSLPSRLSAASFPSSYQASLASNSIPPVPSVPAALSSKAGSIISETGSANSAATATNIPPDLAGTGTSSGSGAGAYVCGCCPKRPQRFDTLDELKLHQTKKPHICAFCQRRFSRMNEAERHITTIHLRPFSWSCRRLATHEAAYQCVTDTDETGAVKTYDVCGFCGKQFERGVDPPGALAVHVEVDHKLHECKASAKKFYREDMFGQHLKLSHAAEAGVWLKFLENACKADEKAAELPGGNGPAASAMMSLGTSSMLSPDQIKRE